ncbi:MAG: citrate lyase acyl carrier protein [Tenericutes bacterium HGW-Tenericutes-6]|jgi:citrate lyase subunit gamma (acyl carrier protein)|nr:MAG: citrate lyase acyl carrier protein [Tenericutes bacterium HGW-Tenericutes-6]
MMIARCGTIESNDCLITVQRQQAFELKIDSIVFDQFGKQIEKVIKDTLTSMGIKHIYVHIQDKGALDYTIKARLITALKRLEKTHAS